MHRSYESLMRVLDVRIMVAAPPCIVSRCVQYEICLRTPSTDEDSCPCFWNTVSVHPEKSEFPPCYANGQCRRQFVLCRKRLPNDQTRLLLQSLQARTNPFVSYKLSHSHPAVLKCCNPF